MILLQLSAGKGPEECCRAVGLAMHQLAIECKKLKVKLSLLESYPSEKKGAFRSALFQLEGDNAQNIAKQWQGGMLWISPSPYRPRHNRKNWYFGGEIFEIKDSIESEEIKFQACRASGAGGQHVNTTDSAVRATHIATGIAVRVESERSQHANKKLARILIQHKLLTQQSAKQSEAEKERWLQHQNLERGNPTRVFRGERFKSE